MTRLLLVALAALAAACGDAHGSGEPSRTAARRHVAGPAAADTPFVSATVFVGCGFQMVQNHGAASFMVLLRGEDAMEVPNDAGASWWMLDGVLVETQLTNAAAVGAPDARGAQLLRRHMEWEAGFTSRQNGWDELRPTARDVDMGTGIPMLTWGYDTPTPLRVLGFEVTRVLYFTAAVDSLVFVASAPLRPDDDPARVARTIRRSMATLRTSEGPVDAHALSARVQAAPPPWEGCPRD